jgi:hypothetical protein
MSTMSDDKLGGYRTQIEAALVYSGHTHKFDDVVALVEAGKAQAWFGPSSIIVTEIVLEPQVKVLHYFLAGGNLAELEAMYPIVEQWGREHGCKRATLVGRKGWERTFLNRQGWTNGLVVLEKKFDE